MKNFKKRLYAVLVILALALAGFIQLFYPINNFTDLNNAVEFIALSAVAIIAMLTLITIEL